VAEQPAVWKGLCSVCLCCSPDTGNDAVSEETRDVWFCSSGSLRFAYLELLEALNLGVGNERRAGVC